MVFLNIFFPSVRKRLEAPIGDFTDRTVFKGPRTYVLAPCRVRRSSPPRFWRIWWTHLGCFGGSSPRSGPHREIASDPTKTEPGLIRPESFILLEATFMGVFQAGRALGDDVPFGQGKACAFGGVHGSADGKGGAMSPKP